MTRIEHVDQRVSRSMVGSDPTVPDGPDEPTSDPFSDLYRRRSVWLRTPLDHDAANRLSAELMALDVQSDGPIELVINSPGGDLENALMVIDTLDLLKAPVNTLCLGEATGAAAAVLACGRGRRRATPTARLSLRLRSFRISGPASRLHGEALHLAELHDRLSIRLAEATGQLPAVIALHLEQGGFMTAEQAVGYGLIDEVAQRR